MLIDVHPQGGQSYREARDVVVEQLGELQSADELAGDNGRLMRFENGAVQVVDDEIVMLRIPLPSPMRRSEALEALGFPPYVGRYITLHREYRLNHEWGFRRIRMSRESRSSELVTQVEAWFRVPGESRTSY